MIGRLRGRLGPGARRTAGNSGWLLLPTITGVLVGFPVTLLVSRALGPAGYGQLALVTVWTQTIFVLCNPATATALIRFVTKFRQDQDPARAAGLVKLAGLLDVAGVTLGALLTLVLGAVLGQGIVGEGALAAFAAAALWYVVLVPRATVSAVLRVTDRFRDLGLLLVAASVVGNLAGLAAIWSGGGLVGYFLARAATEGLVLLAGVLLAIRATRRALGVPLAAGSARDRRLRTGEILGFWRSTYASGVVYEGSREADVIVLGLFQSESTVGIYRLAKQFAGTVITVVDPIGNALYPDIARRWLGGDAGLGGWLKRLTLVLAGLGVVLIGGSMLVVPFAIPLLAGEAFAPAGLVFVVMMLGFAPYVPLLWTQFALYSAGRANWVLRVTVVSQAAFWGGAFLVAPVGAVAMAGWFAVIRGVPMLVNLVLVRRLLRERAREQAAGP